MRRLARQLFALCSAASLVLSVAACVLWVRSYWSYDDWQYSGGATTIDVMSANGRVLVNDVRTRPGAVTASASGLVHSRSEPFLLGIDNRPTWLHRHFGYDEHSYSSRPVR